MPSADNGNGYHILLIGLLSVTAHFKGVYEERHVFSGGGGSIATPFRDLPESCGKALGLCTQRHWTQNRCDLLEDLEEAKPSIPGLLLSASTGPQALMPFRALGVNVTFERRPEHS